MSQLGHKLCTRNGFGPVEYFHHKNYTEKIPPNVIDDPNYKICHQLHCLLTDITLAEEAAIRQITPLISIVRLTHGNCATKGNTSCVWQESKLRLILPNLPKECCYVLIRYLSKKKRKNNEKSPLKSTKFKRKKIELILKLLVLTVPGVWKNDDSNNGGRGVTIDNDRLNAWPEEGDLLDLDDCIKITEVDKHGNVVEYDEDEDRMKDKNPLPEDSLVKDGNDLGPAPLQNAIAPLETFEGINDIDNKNTASIANAELAIEALNEHLQYLENDNHSSDDESKNNDSSKLSHSNNSDSRDDSSCSSTLPRRNKKNTAIFDHDDICKNNEFVDMDDTEYVWARTFPSLFIPIYVNGKWVIRHDYTGTSFIRDYEITFNEWAEYQMWRSDGMPASHPTFSIVVYNHKIRHLLQGQGKHALNISGLNPNMKADDFLRMRNEDVRPLKKKVKISKKQKNKKQLQKKVAKDSDCKKNESQNNINNKKEHDKDAVNDSVNNNKRKRVNSTDNKNKKQRRNKVAKDSDCKKNKSQINMNNKEDDKDSGHDSVNNKKRKRVKSSDNNEDKSSYSTRNKLFDMLRHYSANVAGTKPFWNNTKREFHAYTSFKSHIDKEEISLFHTGSLAEFHEYPLRLILDKYRKTINHPKYDKCSNILQDHTQFQNTVNEFKQVVTFYAVSKMEIWMALFMKPVHGVTEGALTHEFSDSRGAIHYHSILYTKDPTPIDCLPNEVGDTINDLISSALTEHATVISSNLDQLKKELFAIPGFEDAFKKEIKSKKAKSPKEIFEALKKIGETSKGNRNFVKKFVRQNDQYEQCLNKKISNILESNFGYSAMHVGNFPDDWLKPGGQKEHNYRQTCPHMLSSTDVIERDEMKQMKCLRENELFDRMVNIQNHVGTHKCSDYCKVIKKVTVLFDPKQHKDVIDTKFKGIDGKDYCKVEVIECKFGFGQLLQYDPSGEKTLTRGMEPMKSGYVSFDKNQQQKYIGRRNHPRIVLGPYSALFFGANNDTQRILVNLKGEEKMLQHFNNSRVSDNYDNETSMEEYENLINNLRMQGKSGLEQYTGAETYEEYLCGYACKDIENSQNWIISCMSISEAFLNKDDNRDTKNLRSLVAKHQNEIIAQRSVTRDQTQYCLAGGQLRRTTNGSTRKFSVNEIEIQSIKKDDKDDDTKESKDYSWQGIEAGYKKYAQSTKPISLYEYIAYVHHGKKNVIEIPHALGYDYYPSWPLKEEYSKWQLTFYKPWNKSIDELRHKDGTFASALEEFMFDSKYPSRNRNKILKIKNKRSSVIDQSEGDEYNTNKEYLSPTDPTERLHTGLEDALDTVISPIDMLGQETEFLDDVKEQELIELTQSELSKNHDWSRNYDESKADWLIKYQEKFYKKNDHYDNDFGLIKESHYRPEKAKGDAQKLLVFVHLYQHYLWKEYEEKVRIANDDDDDGMDIDIPPSLLVKVQGKPGTGKSFVANTVKNITRTILNAKRDEASCPTGCAASLIGGKTHFRALHIPAGKALHDKPSHFSGKKVTGFLDIIEMYKSIWLYIMDEDSMAGFQLWAYFKQRLEQFRRHQKVVDIRTLKTIFKEMKKETFPPQVYKRPWGGIPVIYSFGDIFQLAPVGMTSISQLNEKGSSKKVGKSGHLGKLAFKRFLDPDDVRDARSLIVMMNQVQRQNQSQYKLLLDNARYGKMSQNDVNILLSRCYYRLKPEEQKSFDEAIHLCPTWSQTHGITVEYLKSLSQPVSIIKAQYHTTRTCNKNCHVTESSYPNITAITIGALVMLLRNFIVELNLMNGAVGKVIDICYPEGGNPSNQPHPAYAVVDCKNSTIPEEDKCFRDLPSTYVPVPLITEICQEPCKRCKISTIPLRTCKAITIHKGQGINIGEGQDFEKVVIYFTEGKTRNAPGIDLVALSRAQQIEDIAIGNQIKNISKNYILNIGKGGSYDILQSFEEFLESKAQSTQQFFRKAISKLDTNKKKQTFEGGCDFLLHWYRNLNNSDMDIHL